jgi:hypothetical protein
MAAERNLPLPELAWLRTGPASRVEIEFDEGSALRLGPDSLAEISDYTRLSTGQRVTLLSVDRGLAYFTGQPEGKDSLSIAAPGAHLILTRGARIRIHALEASTEIAIIEGAVRVSSPLWETEVREGQTVRIDPASPSRFNLYREIGEAPLDVWSEDRDKALAAPTSRSHVSQRYGLADLDSAGEWVQTDAGAVWKPKAQDAWTPYQKGRWRWYDAVGYAWVGDETWGWLPYHYGRWRQDENLGWIWNPRSSGVFKPGEVYWLRGAKLAGWGPLAPGEDWKPSAPPLQFLNANTTYAAFQQDARTIDPAGFTERPKEPLGAAVFTLALPSPAFAAARLDAARPALRAGSTRVTPALPGVTYDSSAPPLETSVRPPAVVTNPGTTETSVVITEPPPEAYPPPTPVDVIYPVPVYTGIIVVNPPENPDYGRRRPRPGSPTPPATPSEPSTPAAPAATSRGSIRETPVVHRPEATAPASQPPPPTARPSLPAAAAHRSEPAPPASRPSSPRTESAPKTESSTDTDKSSSDKSEKSSDRPASRPATDRGSRGR